MVYYIDMNRVLDSGKTRSDILLKGINDKATDDRQYAIEGGHNISHRAEVGVSPIVDERYRLSLLKKIQWTRLTEAFFSPRNIQTIQNAIRAEISAMTGKVIAEQDEMVLLAIMQSTYYQFCANAPTHIKEQIGWLNKLVVQQCVGQIAEAIDMYEYYLSTAFDVPEPFQRAVNASSAGRKNEARFMDPGF
jgi:hypothetical protein